MPGSGTPSRLRRWSSAASLVLACVIFSVGLLALWAHDVVYNSNSFADRSVSMLKEPAVRTELASRITEQLAQAGNQNAVNFRPAVPAGGRGRDRHRHVPIDLPHRGVPDPRGHPREPRTNDSAALNLSDSVSIIVSNLSLPSNAESGPDRIGRARQQPRVTSPRQLTDLHVWDLDQYVSTVAAARTGRRPTARGCRDRRCRLTVAARCADSVGVCWPAAWSWPRWSR